MLCTIINIILFYILLPLLVSIIVFIILIGLFEPVSLLWFSFLWEYLLFPIAKTYFIQEKKQLFKDMDDLKSSDPELIKENSIRILEIGAGTGPNFQYYPKNCRIITVDKNGHFSETLLNNASKFPNITVENTFFVKGENLRDYIEDGYCDAVVLTHVLCSADDHIAVLKEAYRTLKKGGTLYILEHVRYRNDSSFNIQRLVNPIWSCLNAGCQITRHITVQTLKDVGFRDINLEYFEFKVTHTNYVKWLVWFVQPNIIGRAIK